MTIGCIEDVTFEVSDGHLRRTGKIFTPNKIGQKYSATYGSHARASGDTLIDFASEDSETYSLGITLSEFEGVNVVHSINLLREYLREGKACRMVFGNRPCGKYRWVIQDMSVTEKMWAKDGTCIAAEVSLSLLEYLRK